MIVRLLDLVPVKDGELFLEVLIILIVQQIAQGPAVEWKNGHHVCGVELEKWLQKDFGLGLVFHQLKDVTLGRADVETLKQEEFPERQLMYVNVVYANEIVF